MTNASGVKLSLHMKRIAVLLILFFSPCLYSQEGTVMNLESPLSRTGSICFVLTVDQDYINGEGQQEEKQVLLELGDLAEFHLHKTESNIRLVFFWKEYQHREYGFIIQRISLPKGKYFFQFSWDANRGISDGYMNGVSLRRNQIVFTPWTNSSEAKSVYFPKNKCEISDFQAVSHYKSPAQLKEDVPEDYIDESTDLHYYLGDVEHINLPAERMELLLQIGNPTQENMKNWVLEGPGVIEFENQRMMMSSEYGDVPGSGRGHFNFWCPLDIPESFVIEWEFQLLSSFGCAVAQFAARGNAGEDIFDPKLALRTGHFMQYIAGDINNYLLTYFFNRETVQTGRPYLNLFKNRGNFEVAHGPAMIDPDSRDFHQVKIIKYNNHVQVFIDDLLCINYTDESQNRWGAMQLKGGKFGFRQMAGTIAAYKNIKIWGMK